MNSLPDNYQSILSALKLKIRSARYRAIIKVNAELITVYWEIGSTIIQQQKDKGWGAKIIDKLAGDLKLEFPDMKGFSIRNLKYMRAFADAFPDFLPGQQDAAQLKDQSRGEFVQHPAAQLPWTHIQVVLDKLKTKKERLFYLRKSIENGWSRNTLSLQIESNLIARQGKAISNFPQTLPVEESDLATETFKSPYVFDFISLTEEMKEKDIEKALISHLKRFKLELGKGFALRRQMNWEDKK